MQNKSISDSRSPVELQAELYDSWEIDLRTYAAKPLRVIRISIRPPELGPIEDIEKLGPEFDVH